MNNPFPITFEKVEGENVSCSTCRNANYESQMWTWLGGKVEPIFKLTVAHNAHQASSLYFCEGCAKRVGEAINGGLEVAK